MVLQLGGWTRCKQPLPVKTFVKKYSQGEMLSLETKQSGGKLLPHSDLRGGADVSRGGIIIIRWRALVNTVMNFRVP